MGDKLRQRLSAGQTSAGAGAHIFTQYSHVRTVLQSSKVRLCRLWLNVVRSSGPSRRPGSLANGRSSAFLYISTRDHAFGSFSSSFDRFFAAETVRPVGLPSAHRRTRTGIAAWPARAPNSKHCESWMPQRWKTTKGNHLRARTAKHATSLRDSISAVQLRPIL
jgi:hypothetical protein